MCGGQRYLHSSDKATTISLVSRILVEQDGVGPHRRSSCEDMVIFEQRPSEVVNGE